MASISTQVMDAMSGLFLDALGTDMTAMEEYFPFVTSAFDVMQYMAWCILFLITVWQLFRVFGGPLTDAEDPIKLIIRSGLFSFLIYYAKPIFNMVLNIATVPYTSLMDISMSAEDFTFAGLEQVLRNGILSIVSVITVVGTLLILILMISLGWNYFKLLLETVERYIVTGVLCYTSPLAYAMGASQATVQVFKSWCRMVGSQLFLLTMNVWFLRAFNTSVAQYIANGGALSNGHGSVFLWLFCTLAFLKTAQKFDSYLAAMGLNTAQTGSTMGMELLMAARVMTGFGGGARSAGSAFRSGVVSGTGAAAKGFAAGFANKMKPNSYVRDAVVQGGSRMGLGGGIGFINRAFGGIAARNGAVLTGESVGSVASMPEGMSGKITGDIANRSLGNYLPGLNGKNLQNTEISGGRISTTSVGADGKTSNVELFNAGQYEKPSVPHSMVTASDGSSWYQIATGAGRGEFYQAPHFAGDVSEAAQVAATFPTAGEGISLRTIDDGIMEAIGPAGNSMWYNSAMYVEPDAPHSVITTENGIDWYAMQPAAQAPAFEPGDDAHQFNQAIFREFMPGYEDQISYMDSTHGEDGRFEVRHEDGSGTEFYDVSKYGTPRGDYQVYEDSTGHKWFAIHGDAAVERRPVYENGKPVYDGDDVLTVNVETVRYRGTPNRYSEPDMRTDIDSRPVRRKH